MLLEGADASQVAQSLDFSNLTNALTSAITPAQVLTVMGIVVGATATLFLTVWGGRKIISGVQSVIKRGRIRA